MGTLKVNNIQSVTDGSVTFPQGSVSSQPVTFPSGTASNPSLSFTGDTDTGLYRIDANKIGISTGGSKVGEIGNGYGGFTGNIIQVQSTTKTDKFNTTSTSYVGVTGLNVSITPRYSSSRIYIVVMLYAAMTNSTTTCLRIDRSGTAIFENTGSPETGYLNFNTSSVSSYPLYYGLSGLDSPNTTSSLTYTVQVKVGSGTVYIGTNQSNYYGCTSTITAMEVQQ